MHQLNNSDFFYRELIFFAHDRRWRVSEEDLWLCADHLSEKIKETGHSFLLPKTASFLTRKECADLLRISLPTLDRLIQREGLPNIVKNAAGNKKRIHRIFSRQEVLDWAVSHLSSFKKGA